MTEPMQGGGKPSVSVLMPARNAQRFVAETIRSLQAQTMGQWELVVVDDGSTDDTPRILADFAKSDPRIRIVRQEGAGLVAALQRGLQECRCEHVARIDADDLARPERLALQVRHMESDPACVAVGGAIQHVDEDGDPVMLESFPLCHEAIDDNLVHGRAAMAHPAVMFRRSVVQSIGGYRPMKIAEDLDLWLRLAEVGRLANLEEVVLDYRRHGTSLVQATMDVRNECVNAVLADARQRRGMPPIPPSKRKKRRQSAGMTLHGKLARMAARSGHPRVAWKHLAKQWRHSPFHPTTLRVALETTLTILFSRRKHRK